MHLQVSFDNSVLGEDTIVGVACVATMTYTTDLVTFLEGLCHSAANFLDDAGVVTP
jgi:hypothetical protein